MGAVEQSVSESSSVATVDDVILLQKIMIEVFDIIRNEDFGFAELLDENSVLQFFNLQLRNFVQQFCRSNLLLYSVSEIFIIYVLSTWNNIVSHLHRTIRLHRISVAPIDH